MYHPAAGASAISCGRPGKVHLKGIQLGYGFLGALLAGTALGYFADRWLGSAPWGLLIGIVLGFASGLYGLYVALQRQDGTSDGQ